VIGWPVVIGARCEREQRQGYGEEALHTPRFSKIIATRKWAK
jgi:hypothetical protein